MVHKFLMSARADCSFGGRRVHPGGGEMRGGSMSRPTTKRTSRIRATGLTSRRDGLLLHQAWPQRRSVADRFGGRPRIASLTRTLDRGNSRRVALSVMPALQFLRGRSGAAGEDRLYGVRQLLAGERLLQHAVGSELDRQT